MERTCVFCFDLMIPLRLEFEAWAWHMALLYILDGLSM